MAETCDKPWYAQTNGISNYALYADLPASLRERIKKATSEIFAEYSSYLYRDPFGPPPWGGDPDYPHITLAYGPPILKKDGEIKTHNEIPSVYPELFELLSEHPDVKIEDIDSFNPGWAIVIKIRYSSQQLNLLRKSLRENITVGRCTPDDTDRVKILDERETEYEIKDGYEPGSSDHPWAHTTLALIKPDTPKDIIDEIIAKLKITFSDLMGTREKIESISVITAITDSRLIAKQWVKSGGYSKRQRTVRRRVKRRGTCKFKR